MVVDWGEDWGGELDDVAPHSVVVTHGHPDHAFGLKDDVSVPVYATAETWRALDEEGGFCGVSDRRVVRSRRAEDIEGMTFEPFDVAHSTRAPAVGYRITAGKVTVFYVPDVVYIRDRADALEGCKVYIGDGATMKRSMVRKPGETIIGHTPMRTQLTWCKKEGVGRAIFTHCGSGIVGGDEREVAAELRELADERGVEAEIARDGMVLVLR